jgi:hypothetical protein
VIDGMDEKVIFMPSIIRTVLRNLLLQFRHNFGKWDLLVFACITALGIINGSISVFYLMYFFWWNELIRICVDKFFLKRNKNIVNSSKMQEPGFGPFFQMGIYFVFVVVFFGILANMKNTDIFVLNMETLFFQNVFFNINLLFVLAERIYLHKLHTPLKVETGIFTSNMIVLHISIILGAIMMFFVVGKFPETFTPDNLWGSLLVALPFILLKMGLQYFSNDEVEISKK